MHLKSYPKLVRSELRLDASGVQTSSQRSSLFVSQQGGLLRTCSSDHGNNNSSSSRLPLSIISTNMLRCSNMPNSSCSSVATLRLRAPPSTAPQLLLPLPGCENHTPELFQTAAEDTDTPLDIWTVIKPGHVREKIAIFASEGGQADSAGGGASSIGADRALMMCTNNAVTGCSRAAKAKGSWEENCSAKRRRRSGNKQNLQQDPGTQDTPQHTIKQSPRQMEEDEKEEEHQKVSVVEMVAFLEQRASEQRLNSKPLLTLQRSSTTITLSKAPPPDTKGEGLESFRVSDMVAKLESECLRRSAEGDLSRNNSLRRTVGRVLLVAAATGDQSSASCQPLSPSSSSPPAVQSPNRKPISCPESIRTETPPLALAPPPSGEVGGRQTLNPPLTQTPPPQPEEAEPLPGLLFLPLPPLTDPHPSRHKTTFELEPAPGRPRSPSVSLSPCGSGSQSEKRRWSDSQERQEEEAGLNQCSVVAPLSWRPSASQDFLELRQRVQQLLEPQPYLSALPHHLLLHILRLLPTQSLAALKCTCSYFKFVIETYGVRPADSLWVSDPRYRDDPCKQCKKRYGHGDVSLCRWHHKPYCQALPYGPGYWMCCRGAHRDAPGCNVGLHDNCWVPAFHSINVPIYRRIGNLDD